MFNFKKEQKRIIKGGTYANLSSGLKKKIIKKAIVEAAKEQKKIYDAYERKYGSVNNILCN